MMCVWMGDGKPNTYDYVGCEKMIVVVFVCLGGWVMEVGGAMQHTTFLRCDETKGAMPNRSPVTFLMCVCVWCVCVSLCV